MGLKTLVSRGSYFARFGTYVRGNHGDFAPNPALGPWDPVATALQGVVMDWGWFQVEPAIGLYPNQGEAKWIDVLRTKPNTRRYDGGADWRHNGGYLSSLAGVSRIMHGVPFPLGVPARERDTWHPGVRGTVGPSLEALEYWSDERLSSHQSAPWAGVYPSGPGFRALPFPYRYHRSQVVCVKSFPNDLFESYDPPGFDPEWAARRTVLSSIKDMFDGVYYGDGTSVVIPFFWGGNCTLILNLDDLSVSRTKVTLDYRVRIYSSSPDEIGDVLWKMRLTLALQEPKPPTEHLVIDEIRDVWGRGPAKHWEVWETTCLESSRPDRSQIWFGPAGAPGYHSSVSNYDGTRQTGWLLASDTALSEANDRPIHIATLEKNLGLAEFEFNVARAISDIRPASFISTSDAMGELEDTSSNNLIETLVQLGGVAEYLPRLRSVITILVSLRRGKPLETLGEVIDFATELQLRSAFTYGPDIRFVQETLPILGRIAGQMAKSKVQTVVGRGSMRYSFPEGEFQRKRSTLEVRTKVVARRDFDSVLSKVLGVDALGLLPVPSNAWDLIPLSFVLDWFVGLGDRLKDIERNALLVALGPTYLVHSYLVRSPFEDDELEKMGIQAFGIPGELATAPELRVYDREVSTHIPSPRASRYDFHMPSRLPFWATATSLMWQLAK